ncbi:hypothetical protein JXC34_02615, partial [Candidatus Woesearchaeota archaeon]|nr:hypothetical protein [Candidatus Woesearchaeota archaeon]
MGAIRKLDEPMNTSPDIESSLYLYVPEEPKKPRLNEPKRPDESTIKEWAIANLEGDPEHMSRLDEIIG